MGGIYNDDPVGRTSTRGRFLRMQAWPGQLGAAGWKGQRASLAGAAKGVGRKGLERSAAPLTEASPGSFGGAGRHRLPRRRSCADWGHAGVLSSVIREGSGVCGSTQRCLDWDWARAHASARLDSDLCLRPRPARERDATHGPGARTGSLGRRRTACVRCLLVLVVLSPTCHRTSTSSSCSPCPGSPALCSCPPSSARPPSPSASSPCPLHSPVRPPLSLSQRPSYIAHLRHG